MSLIYIKNTIEILNNILESDTFPLMSGYYTVLPAADVAEVRHGRWERILTASGIISRVRCSICAGTQPLTFENMSYCPNCGTRMDKENKHKVRCAKCRKIKEIVCTVDGKPWCEDCFDKAMGYGDQT